MVVSFFSIYISRTHGKVVKYVPNIICVYYIGLHLAHFTEQTGLNILYYKILNSSHGVLFVCWSIFDFFMVLNIA